MQRRNTEEMDALNEKAQKAMLEFALEFPDLFKRLVIALEKLAKEMEVP